MGIPPALRRHLLSLLNRARRSKLREPTAMTLATTGSSGQPSIRTVLLKEISPRGFVFFTNDQSRKGAQLLGNPRAALCFFWEPLERQVIVEGRVKRISNQEADAYWKTRPRESQLGAWASQQSRSLDRRGTLLKRLSEARKKFRGKAVPRPAYWSGFCVNPERIEIWKRGAARLHHRLLYEKKGNRWKKRLLYP